MIWLGRDWVVTGERIQGAEIGEQIGKRLALREQLLAIYEK